MSLFQLSAIESIGWVIAAFVAGRIWEMHFGINNKIADHWYACLLAKTKGEPMPEFYE